MNGYIILVLDLFVNMCNTYFIMNKKIPVIKNSVYEITARDLSSDGHGIGLAQGFTVFCPGLLPGETARVLIIKVRASYAVGKLLELIQSSPYRTAPPCPAYKDCGGCSLAHMAYSAQLQYKERHVRDCLERIGKASHFTMEPILLCPEQEGYRNKAQYRFGKMQGHICCGFYKEHSHQLIPTPCCTIESPGSDKIRQAVCELSDRLELSVYEEAAHSGLLRSLLIRTSHKTGKAMVILVINGDTLPREEEFVRQLTEQCPQIISIYINKNTRPGNTVLGDSFQKLWGEDTLTDAVGHVVFQISPGAFYQVNVFQVQKLYDTVAQFSGVNAETALLDLYCGVGTIGIYLACTRGVKRLYGIEYVEKAVQDARRNAEQNGLKNYLFRAGDAGEILAEDGPDFQPDVIVIDPPRKGCDRKVLEQAALLGPERIVYVSCNPATLARDVKYLREFGYAVRKVRPVDMFPGTAHVESVVMLSYKQSDNIMK